ncbi:MAG: hypothetical protein JWO28_717 [Hyphomicrobiales bacterium]|nr:hypothetical protein [Hyphomicrobiales bacterium]
MLVVDRPGGQQAVLAAVTGGRTQAARRLGPSSSRPVSSIRRRSQIEPGSNWAGTSPAMTIEVALRRLGPEMAEHDVLCLVVHFGLEGELVL